MLVRLRSLSSLRLLTLIVLLRPLFPVAAEFNESCVTSDVSLSAPGHLLLQTLHLQKKARVFGVECGFAEQPVCGKPVLQTCRDPTQLIGKGQCPSDCQHAAADPYFACVTTCVARDHCSDNGPQATLDDPATLTCKPGHIPGCRVFAEAANDSVPLESRECAECFDVFLLTSDGTCRFGMYGQRIFVLGLLYVAIGIIVIVLPLVIFRMCLPEGNPQFLRMGWDHRTRCFASQHGHTSPSDRWKPLPLSTDMHDTLVAGPGLCIYYNNLVFVGVIAVVVMLLTAVLQLQAMPPWVDEQSKGFCTLSSRQLMEKAAADMTIYHETLMGGMFALWLMLLGLSVWHAGNQHKAFKILDGRTCAMSDFGLHAMGFPPDASENEIEAYFNMVVPGSLVGVSIAYDYTDQQELIEQMLDRHLQEVDVAWWSGHGSATAEAAKQHRLQHGEHVCNVLHELGGTGHAFVVCKTEEGRTNLEHAWNSHPPLFRRHYAIELSDVYGEPQTYHWANFAFNWQSKLLNCLQQTGMIILECVALAALVYVPAAYYILSRGQVTGRLDDDKGWHVVTMVLGLLIAIVNGVVYVFVDIGSRRIGFWYKGSVDSFNMVAGVFIVSFSTLFTLGTNVWVASRAIRHATLDSDSETGIRDVLFRRFLAKQLWTLLVPSLLLVPHLLYPLYKHYFSLKATLAYWVSLPFWPIYSRRDLRSNPKVQLRAVEKGLEPEPMQIEFDYCNNINITSIAFLLLFFETSHITQVSFVVLCWVIFTYGAQKYCHLRLDKVVDYTTPGLHDCVSYLWAMPVSMPAAAAAYWASLAGYAGAGLAIPVYLTAVGIHWILLFMLLNATSWRSDDGKEDYRTTKKRVRADYFNTNPVHVLKSQFLDNRHPLIYFQRGKEYLQESGKRGKHAHADAESSSSAESVVEHNAARQQQFTGDCR